MAAGFGTDPARMAVYNWVHAARDAVLLVDARADGVAGTAAAVHFGATGWLGGITVAPAYRRGGIATALTDAACAWLEERGAATVLLQATPAGQEVYSRLGFTGDGTYEVFAVPEDHVTADHGVLEPLLVVDFEHVLDLDRRATGEDRTRALEIGFPRGWRVGERAVSVSLLSGLGHAVALDAQAGDALLGAAQPGARWAIPGGNAAALEAASRRGWRRDLATVRMFRGPAVEWRPDYVWGAFNLFWG